LLDDGEHGPPLPSLHWDDAPDVLETEEAAYLLRERPDALRARWEEQRRVLASGTEPENPLPVLQFAAGGKMRFDRDLLIVWRRNEIELQRRRILDGPQSVFGGKAKPPRKGNR